MPEEIPTDSIPLYGSGVNDYPYSIQGHRRILSHAHNRNLGFFEYDSDLHTNRQELTEVPIWKQCMRMAMEALWFIGFWALGIIMLRKIISYF